MAKQAEPFIHSSLSNDLLSRRAIFRIRSNVFYIPAKVKLLVCGCCDSAVVSRECSLIGGANSEMPDMYEVDLMTWLVLPLAIAEKVQLYDSSKP